MATEDFVSDVVAEECVICLQPLQDARLLSCLHRFCRRCLANMPSSYADRNTVRCPLCSVRSVLAERGVNALPKDCSQPTDTWFTCRPCDSEGRKRKLTLWCSQCKNAFCSDHAVRHVLSTGGHTIVAIPATGLDPDKPGSLPQLCAEHRQPLRFFCEPCGVAICAECAQRPSGEHDEHRPIVAMQEAILCRKDRVGVQVEALSELIPRLELSLQSDDDVSDRLAQRAENVRRQIRETGQRVMERVKTCVDALLSQVDSIEATRSLDIDRHRQDFSQHLEKVHTAVGFSQRLLPAHQPSTPNYHLANALICLEGQTSALVEKRLPALPGRNFNLTFEPMSEAELARKVVECVGRVRTSHVTFKESDGQEG